MAKEKILVIEDNALNMELVKDLLEAGDYFVGEADSAEEGIQLAQALSPHLILMDIGLPGMDGLRATHILKSNPQTKDIPVVALTAHAMSTDREKVLSAGCNGYITKPIDTRTFLKTIHEYIGKN